MYIKRFQKGLPVFGLDSLANITWITPRPPSPSQTERGSGQLNPWGSKSLDHDFRYSQATRWAGTFESYKFLANDLHAPNADIWSLFRAGEMAKFTCDMYVLFMEEWGF